MQATGTTVTDLPISAEEQEEKAKGLKDGTATDRSVRTETDRHALRTGEIQDLHPQAETWLINRARSVPKKCSTRTGKEINSLNWITAAKRTNRRYRSAHWKNSQGQRNTTNRSLRQLRKKI